MVTYSTADGEQTIIAERIITTTGAYTLPALLPFVPKEKMERISNLHYAPVVQASVGFRDTGALRFDAFGGLVPSCEKKDVLGILFPSACFTGRAPEEGALFSFFIGGVKHADLTTWPEEELKALIRRELHTMLKFPEETEPDMIRIFRHEHAIPQYEQSSGSRFETIDELQARYPGLTLAGNIKGGIGMADRIRPLLGDRRAIEGKRYDFILANINRNVLLADMDAYAAALHSGGMLFLSGILETDVDAVTDRAQQFGFERLQTRTRSGWAVVRFKKK
mgnify:FL=1